MLEAQVLTLKDSVVKVAKIERQAAELFADRKRGALVGRIRAAGCEVGAVLRCRHGVLCGVYANLLLVNGHLCSIHLWTTIERTSKCTRRFYISVPLSYYKLMEVEAVLFYTAVPNLPEHVFVVPSALLRARVFGSSSQDTKAVYLPVEKLPVYNNVYPRIDYWEYENAWWILPPKK